MTALDSMLPPAYCVGDLRILTLPDGSRSFPLPDGFVRNADRDQVNAALNAAGMKKDEMTIVFNPILISRSNRHILVDAGNGEAANTTPTGPGQLLASLERAGVVPDQIELVVVSHFHGDHINGLLRADGSLTFPSATVTVPEPEWAFWTDHTARARSRGTPLEAAFNNVARVMTALAPRIQRHRWDGEVAPGITAQGTPGHTPGHTSYVVSSGSHSLFVQSDVTNHPALFVRNPGWHAAFDMNPSQAEETRRRVYEMLISEKMPVQGFHFPLPSRGFAERVSEGYRIRLIE